MRITGIVLAGGMGQRMGGVDKGLVTFRNKPLVVHVLERIAPQVDSIIINANREQETYRQFGYPVISDTMSDFAGPLAGLHAGMQYANSPLVVSVPCDAPFLPQNLVAKLLESLQQQHADIAVASTNGQLQPVFCLCRTSLAAHLEQFLQTGGRKVEHWLNTSRLAVVAFDDQMPAFTNLNTLHDLSELERT